MCNFGEFSTCGNRAPVGMEHLWEFRVWIGVCVLYIVLHKKRVCRIICDISHATCMICLRYHFARLPTYVAPSCAIVQAAVSLRPP